MNSKVKIIIIAILAIVIVALVVVNTGHKKVVENDKTSTTVAEKPYTKLDKETGEYIVYDTNGEEITRVTDEAAAQIYIDNPDYDPKLPAGDYSSESMDTVNEIN